MFVGQRTLDLYLLHYFFIPDLRFLSPYLEIASQSLITLLIISVITIAIALLCLLYSEIIRTCNVLSHFMLSTK